jgi:hypothetical protein
VPRPVKLKPLKDVLTKLIQQIKKCANFYLHQNCDFTKAIAGKTTMLFSLSLWI